MATILIVDDHVLSRQFLMALLGFEGHTLYEAADGAAALAQAQRVRPDLVVSDILMPTMDGKEFVMRLRADPDCASVPVIFYTATYGRKEARAIARDVGVHWVLHKPTAPAQIVATINEALGLPAPAAAPVPAAPTGRFGSIDQQLGRYMNELDAVQAMQLSRPLAELQTVSMRLTALIDLGIELSSERDPARMLDTACRQARHIGMARYAAVGLFDVAGQALEHVAVRGMAPHLADLLRAQGAGGGVLAEALAERRPRRLLGAEIDMAATGLPDGHPVFHSLLVVPVLLNEHVYGWLYLADKVGEPGFAEGDVEAVAAVATQLAIAFENTRLYDRLRTKLARIEAEAAVREQITRQLQESESRFRELAENIREVFFLIDRDAGKVHYISPAYEQIWGRSCASLYADALSWTASIHPDDLPRIGQAMAASQVAEGEAAFAFNYEYRIVRPDGAQRWIHARGFPIRDADGQVYRVAGIAEDVSAYRDATAKLRESEAGLRRAQQLSRLTHLITGAGGQFESWSANLPQFLGIAETAMPRDTRAWVNLLHPDDRARFRDCSVEAGRNGTHAEIEYRIRHGDNHWMVLHQVLEPIGVALPGQSTRWFNSMQDVTEQRAQQRKLARLTRIHAMHSAINSAIVRLHERDALLEQARLVAVAEGAFSAAGVALVDDGPDGARIASWCGARDDGAAPVLLQAARERRILVINELAAATRFGAAQQDWLAHGHAALAALPLMEGERCTAVLIVFSSESGFFDTDELQLLDQLSADLSFGLQFIAKDERLSYMAYYDLLTGLPNRSLFCDRLAQMLGGNECAPAVVAVLLIELHNFSEFSDVLGRRAGDALLVLVAQRLLASLHGHMKDAHGLARVGDHTFAIAFDNLRQGPEAVLLAESQLLDALERPFGLEQQELRISVRAGLALYPDDGLDPDTLLKHADLALMRARAGGTRLMCYAPTMNAAIAARLAMEADLRSALAEGQFSVHYQARVDLGNGHMTSAEALLRWQHPQRGNIAPVDFIALAEETGLIVPIGQWVIETVCAQQVAWLAAGLPVVPVAVNLSALQFQRGDLAESIRATMARYQLAQHYLEFELTESSVMGEPRQAQEKLLALKALGAQLALDDFGTGYSSLAYLQLFPFDFVKIDRAFVTNITSNPGDAAIVTAVIAMAHSLNLKVVAEGVETQAQLRFLRARHCDEMQGYLFSRPLPADGFATLLEADRCLELQGEARPDECLLIVDDEPSIVATLQRVLRREGYRIITASNGAEALELLALNKVQVIVSDQRMPGMTGTEFLALVKELYPATIRIILSGYSDLEVVTDSVNRGAVFKFVSKPWDDALLKAHLREAFRLYRAPPI
ncbi:MAG: EAL domain-containing protein [Pseudomonadota bacterium]